MVEAPDKTSPFRRQSAVRSGLLTGLSNLVLSSAAAIAGVYLAHRFGRSAATDGFFDAYGVYLVLVLGAQGFRLVVVPELTRAADQGRLGLETIGFALAFFLLAVPASVLVAVFRGDLGRAITGSLPAPAAHVAARALVFLVPAAFAQLLASLAASALAARNSYAVAALGFAAGGVAGLVVFVLLAGRYGLVALPWGLAVNGAVTLGIPLMALVARREFSGLPGRSVHALRRLRRLFEGAALPLAIQGLYLVALRFAADLGVGKDTSLSFAYLIAGVLVTATASSLSLITVAPLTRRGLNERTAAEHVVHSTWVSLALVAGAAGTFALVGGRIVSAALGGGYTGHAGHELGRLVVYLAPWMVAFSAFAATFPLVFVMEQGRLLVPLALGAVAVDIGLTFGLQRAFGIVGVALAMALVLFAVLAALLALLSRRTLALSARGVCRLTLLVGIAAAVAFGLPALVLGPIAAAVVGILLYAAFLIGMRSLGLGDAWHYLRALD